jgi:transcriptional regulator with XRE-family HTH domain
MSHERYAIAGRTVTHRRKQKGWTQLDLAEESGIAHRKIVDIEHDRGTYNYQTVKWLADALDLPVEELIWACDIDWRAVPPLPTRLDREQVAKAIRLDMKGKGRHREAAMLCREVLERVDGTVGLREQVELQVRLMSMLSNGGEHRKALNECDALLASLASPPEGLVHVRRWVRYWRGIILRRLGRYAEAKEIFLELLAERDDGYVASLHHQLGVLEIVIAKSVPERSAHHLEEAVGHLEIALNRWDEVGARVEGVSHRKGYTLLRLLEACRRQGKIAAAFHYGFEALHWLAYYRCERYVEEAKAELNELLRTVGVGPSGDGHGEKGTRAA